MTPILKMPAIPSLINSLSRMFGNTTIAYPVDFTLEGSTISLQITGLARNTKNPMKIVFIGFQDGEVLGYGEYDYVTSSGFMVYEGYSGSRGIGTFHNHRNQPIFE